MSIENQTRRVTDWLLKSRETDLAWLDENRETFSEVATSGYDEDGRGAIIVNAREQIEDKGHPFGYLPQSVIEEMEDFEVIQMVRQYDPETEMVVILLKEFHRESAYRIAAATTNPI